MKEHSLQLVATSTMGLESVVARELKDLGYEPHNWDSSPGRTSFSGSLADIARANIYLRTAGKILIELARFPLDNDFDTLFDAVQKIDWELWIPPQGRILVEGRSVRSMITSVPALQRTVKKGIVNRLMKAHHVLQLPEDGPEYTVEISLLKDEATITLDTTGHGLHRRGYRLMNVSVPLRETLASALVQLSVWKPGRPLIDPFCASGTIPIEAAMIGRNIPPGLNRVFASQSWPIFNPSIWQQARQEARDLIAPPLEMKIIGSDIDAQAIEYARYHARRAGVADDIIFESKDFRNLCDERPYGCIICNPPYGDRVGQREEFRALYESMPSILSKLPTWSHFIYTSWNDFEELIGQKATRRRKLYNSRIECTYFQFLGPRPPKEEHQNQQENQPFPQTRQAGVSKDSLPETVSSSEDVSEIASLPANQLETISKRDKVAPVFAGLDDYANHQLQEFTRCLQNRARHLRRYTKRGITCYRLYDRDFPEVPLAIDLFDGTWLHIAEYDRPDERSPAMHRVWLDSMIAAAAKTLEILPENVFVKRRIRQRGESQYEKLAECRKIVTVHEGGLAFQCNMTDYLDVGLFLDHRITRNMVRNEAKGKRFLNLFCYTGAFTCYAASGGASSSVSVDLSPTYLDWARDNLRLNAIPERAPDGKTVHRFVKADTLAFLRAIPPCRPGNNSTKTQRLSQHSHQANGLNFGVDYSDFDLCICDPPTYSNSKSTQEDWDVQQCHCELLRLLATRMVPGGIVYFSTNYRRFKFDEQGLSDLYRIREISGRTVPEEFRNKRIHRCWRLVVTEDAPPRP